MLQERATSEDSDIAEGTASVTSERLRSFIERIERLHEERDALANDISEVISEAKATGFCTKTIRKIIRMRKQDLNQRKEEEALLETYMAAIGMI